MWSSVRACHVPTLAPSRFTGRLSYTEEYELDIEERNLTHGLKITITLDVMCSTFSFRPSAWLLRQCLSLSGLSLSKAVRKRWHLHLLLCSSAYDVLLIAPQKVYYSCRLCFRKTQGTYTVFLLSLNEGKSTEQLSLHASIGQAG